ncbi:hypothetical protein GRO01_07140 [Gluconobacter roseus NBRC 3990]|uniref:Uncharacterized protein n=1 Tax=Gluconobacter roseus NBRC 3990 TaxID=1307950 RepID=A0A4Y3M6R6_9PROT|nr:hypothetical protein GRO01_07140 [Gluconobacter roseus NBRC 3990]GLP93596.1 hypothetical protein GCM10007871_15740 [Gluconobacter roseus NBRC 3990]
MRAGICAGLLKLLCTVLITVKVEQGAGADIMECRDIQDFFGSGAGESESLRRVFAIQGILGLSQTVGWAVLFRSSC